MINPNYGLTVYGTGRITINDKESYKNFSNTDNAIEYIRSRRDWSRTKRRALVREIREINGEDYEL